MGQNQLRIQEMLRYEPDTGHFYWKYNSNAVSEWNETFAGRRADVISELGYMVITFYQRAYLAHRIAYAIMTDDWQFGIVDHIDRDRSNNRWVNLRAATPSQNAINSSVRSDNVTGHKGVSFKTKTGRWFARITLNGQTKHLGYFSTKEEAIAARAVAEAEMHGEFAAIEPAVGNDNLPAKTARAST